MSLTGRYAMAEPVLKKGSNDPAVRDLQEALKILGIRSGARRWGFRGANRERGQKFSAGTGNPGRWSGWPSDVDQHRRSRPEPSRAEDRLDWLTRPPSAEPDERSRLRIQAALMDVSAPKPKRRSRNCSKISTSPWTESSARGLGTSSMPWRMKAAPANPGSTERRDTKA